MVTGLIERISEMREFPQNQDFKTFFFTFNLQYKNGKLHGKMRGNVHGKFHGKFLVHSWPLPVVLG